jgi:Tol biopolymer transport system component
VDCGGIGGSDVGGFGDPLGLTDTGSFYYRVSPVRLRDFKIASIDFSSGRVIAQPVQEFQGFPDGFSWSPDGQHVIYFQPNPARLFLRSHQTGRTRQITVADGNPRLSNVWSPDGRSYAFSSVRDGKVAVHRADITTAEVRLISAGTGPANVIGWPAADTLLIERTIADSGDISLLEHNLRTGAEREVFRIGAASARLNRALSRDARTFFYRRPVTGAELPHDLVARNLAAGSERVLARLSTTGGLHPSPDGRYVAIGGLAASSIAVISTTGEERRDLTSEMRFMTWAPDSRSILARKVSIPDPQPTLWLIPIDGSQPRQLDLAIDNAAAQFAVNGNRLAFIQRASGVPDQVWVLENFLKPIGR